MPFSCCSLWTEKKKHSTRHFCFCWRNGHGQARERIGEGFKFLNSTLQQCCFWIFCRLCKAAERWWEKSIWAFDGRDKREEKDSTCLTDAVWKAGNNQNSDNRAHNISMRNYFYSSRQFHCGVCSMKSNLNKPNKVCNKFKLADSFLILFLLSF